MATVSAGPGITYDQPTASSIGAIPDTEKGAPNGVATLGPDGRIPSSELALDALEYKGSWNAATNTPTLVDGTGTKGDTYAVSVGGTQNLGGGSVAYTAGDLVIYNGTTWDQITTGNPVTPANPSSLVGTAAINGAAATFMRSDAAPAVNQAMVPTWTGIHTFNGSTSSTTPSIVMGGNNPELRFFNSTAPLDQKYWRLRTTSSGFNIQTADDASGGGGGGSNPFLSVGRTGVNIDSVFIGPSANWMTITPTTVASGGTWSHTGGFGVVNSAAGTPASLGSSLQAFTSGNISTVAHVNSLNTVDSRTFYAQWDNNYTYSLGFANDAFNSLMPALQIQGGAGFGITQIQSNSGAGAWTHSGAFQANGTVTANTYNGNGIVQTGSAPGGVPSISTMGVDNNVSLTITTKGSAGITLDRATTVTGALAASGGLTVGGKPVTLVVATDGKVAQAANVNVSSAYTVPTSGMYRVSTFIVVSQAATTSSTMPAVNVTYTEATTSTPVSDLVTSTAAGNTVGLHLGGTAVIQAQQGSTIGYATTGYASSGATPMQYSINIKVEALQ